MKYLKIAAVCCFAVVLLLPLFFFNTDANAISEIDNRALAPNPFTGQHTQDLTDSIEAYVSDRIGFRDKMILSYTVLNDRLFGKMVHPSYIYGKDGYIFGAGIYVSDTYGEFHEAFADMALAIQEYCDARDVPFLLVFEPAKPAVLTEYIADGIRYDHTWEDKFFAALDARGVNYLDNTQTLRALHEDGIAVFNQKYDANHWNDLGAYYGTKKMMEILQQDIPSVHVIQPDELTISEKVMTSLLVSEFPIHEAVPAITVNGGPFDTLTKKYDAELYRHSSHRAFGYNINCALLEAGAPKALVFQGSYLNGYGYKYLLNSLGEYIYVHDYQNVIDFPYYFNIFKPDCVIFEVGEYTLTNSYFNLARMQAIHYNPTLEDAYSGASEKESRELDPNEIAVEQGEALTKISWASDSAADHAWLQINDNIYDMFYNDGKYETTVCSEDYDPNQSITIVTEKGSIICTYSSR